MQGPIGRDVDSMTAHQNMLPQNGSQSRRKRKFTENESSGSGKDCKRNKVSSHDSNSIRKGKSEEVVSESNTGDIKKKKAVKSTGNRKLSKSERNKLYYEKNKDKIKESKRLRIQNAKKENSELSKCSTKLTRTEINRRYYEKHKEKIKESWITKYKDPVRQAAELAQKRAAYALPENRIAKLAAWKKSYNDPIKHAAQLAQKKAEYAVPEKRLAKLARQRMSYKNPVNKALLLTKRKVTQAKKIASQSDYSYLLSQARKAMLEMPTLACTVCHRARFKEQVKLCHRGKYPQKEAVMKCFTGKYIHKCSTSCNDTSVDHKRKKQEWICHTCHRHLLKGNMPPQASVNNLWLDDIPDELKALNALEMHLVSIIQPFMKIVPLPRGAQKGVRGQMVCVPANLQRTADSLPWTLNTGNLIRVKLKRKQQYKGHHLCMTVSQKRVMEALERLMEINPAYKGK